MEFLGSYEVTTARRSSGFYCVKWNSSNQVKTRYTALTGMDCTCGRSKMKRKPCKHEIAAAKTALVPIDHTFFGECFSARTWKSQYADISNLLPLSKVEYEFKDIDSILIPFVPNQPRGRPSNHERHKRKLEIIATSLKKLRSIQNGVISLSQSSGTV